MLLVLYVGFRREGKREAWIDFRWFSQDCPSTCLAFCSHVAVFALNVLAQTVQKSQVKALLVFA